MARKKRLLGPFATSPLEDHSPETRPKEMITFPGCAYPTVGVELELSLVDPETGKLVPRASEIIDAVEDAVHFKGELFQTIIEINTGVCNTVAEIRADLESRLTKLREVCDPLGIDIMCVGTHPSADYRELPITARERYERLVGNMRWPARRLLICGVHVHVGVESGEHVVALLDSMTVFIPHLLALSASSPFWMGEDTGLASTRIKIFEGLPTAGLPPEVTNWREFAALIRTLMAAGSIESIREIWWDIRPHPGFGTLEIRICDGINTLNEICALTAFVQCLIAYLQELYNYGEPLPRLRNWTLRENKWRACRYGIDAQLIRNERGTQSNLRDHINEWLEAVTPTARKLGCERELLQVNDIFDHGPSYARQRALVAETDSFQELVAALVEEFRTDTPLVVG